MFNNTIYLRYIHSITMGTKLSIVAAAVFVIAMIQPAYAFRAQLLDAPQAGSGSQPQLAIDTNAGFIIGAHDGTDKCQPECHSWIDLPGNGFANKTQQFIRGYVYGYCTNQENIGGAGREDDYNASFDCDKGPMSASWDVPQVPPTPGLTNLPNMPQVNNTLVKPQVIGNGNETNSTG
jgi:hypothetical protein